MTARITSLGGPRRIGGTVNFSRCEFGDFLPAGGCINRCRFHRTLTRSGDFHRLQFEPAVGRPPSVPMPPRFPNLPRAQLVRKDHPSRDEPSFSSQQLDASALHQGHLFPAFFQPTPADQFQSALRLPCGQPCWKPASKGILIRWSPSSSAHQPHLAILCWSRRSRSGTPTHPSPPGVGFQRPPLSGPEERNAGRRQRQ